MRAPNNKRARGRSNRRSPNPNRSYESNGPDGKIRGNANQVYDKYSQLARDAAASGDIVAAEGFWQHAEHYYRIMMSMQQNRAQQQNDQNDNNNNNNSNDGGEQQQNNNNRGAQSERQPDPSEQEQPDVQSTDSGGDGEAVEESDTAGLERAVRRTRRPRRPRNSGGDDAPAPEAAEDAAD